MFTNATSKSLMIIRPSLNYNAFFFSFFFQIHDFGMQVYAYTFKNELSSLKWDYQGDVRNELQQFFKLGLEGYFSDFPATLKSFRDSK